jgi:dissimilatory sulfite reductase (desulfoviridin) alpha/beta subunit
VVKHWELDFEKGVQKEIYNKKLGKTIWKVGWDQFGSLLCVSLLTTDNTNETYLFELQGNEFYKKSQLTEDED